MQCRLDAIKWASHHRQIYHSPRVPPRGRIQVGGGERATSKDTADILYGPSTSTPPCSSLAPIARTNPFSLFLTCETGIPNAATRTVFTNPRYWSIPTPLVNSLISLYKLCIDFRLFNCRASSKMASGEARIREFLWNVDSRLIEFCQFKFILTRNSTFYSLGKIRRVSFTESWNDLNLIGFIAMNGVKFNESR